MAKRRRLAPDERRAAILPVARELFSRRPYRDVSMADIASAAGVSPPLIAFHYGSKRSLYLEVIRSAVATIGEGLRAIPGPPSLDRLHAGVRFYAEYALSHRAGFLSLLRGGTEASMPEASGLVETLRAQVADQIITDISAAPTGAADGTPGTPVDEAEQVRLMIAVRGYLGYVDAAMAHWLDLPDEQRIHVDPDTVATLAVGAFTGALAALTSSTPPGSPEVASPPGS